MVEGRLSGGPVEAGNAREPAIFLLQLQIDWPRRVDDGTAMEAYLRRVERDPRGVPIKLYPFTRKEPKADTERAVVIDPAVEFDRPVLSGTRAPTAVLADRFKAGDTLQELADDYRTTPQAIEEALRCELDRREAA